MKEDEEVRVMERNEEKSILDRLNENIQRMSKGQRKIADFFTNEYDKAAFMTAAVIGEEVGVSESTVVRFAGLLGYGGFSQMQKSLQNLVRNRIHQAPMVDTAIENISRQDVLEQVIRNDVENICNTLNDVDRTVFDSVIDILLSARRIYVVGIRNSSPLAAYLGFYLRLMFDNVIVVSSDNSSELFEQLIGMNEEDCMIGISFPRYSMRTLKAMEFANSRNVRTITITDSVNSPMNLYSSCNLIATSQMTSVTESLVAPMSIVNAIVVAVMAKKKKKLVNRLEMLEDICNEYALSGNDELNWVDDSDMAKK